MLDRLASVALAGGLAGSDLDPAGLYCLRDSADQMDLQKPVLKRGVLDLDVIFEAELTLELPGGDPLVEIFLSRLLGRLLGSATRHRQHVLLYRDGDILRGV